MSGPESHCIHRLFQRAVRRAPERIALRLRGAQWSYRELDARANFLAAHLNRRGLEPGGVAALALARSPEMIVAMLATLKCGGAYLPLDPGNPVRRNLWYLQAADARIIIADHDCAELAAAGRVVVSTTERRWFETGAGPAVDADPNPDARAYIMFTSGSSGRPKGVVVPHRAVARLVTKPNYVSIEPGDAILQFSPPSFDASTFEIWGALLNGATLVLYSGAVLDPNLLKSDIRDRGVTILWLTAALFHLIADQDIETLRPIKQLLAGGDVLNPRFVNKVLDTVPGITVINGYGPTENTTFTCCHRMTAANRPGSSVPIGRAISGTRVHVLDESLKPVPRGAVGELYAAGAGVALGYLGEHRTNGAFFVDRLIDEGLIYRTGDLVRMNAAGEVEFVGRRDNQVKVRGYRVALEEIEAQLLELEHVNDAAVVVRREESGDQLLVAYLKIDPAGGLTRAAVRRRLAEVLPRYMVPDQVVMNTDLPITANGKIDRKRIQTTFNHLA